MPGAVQYRVDGGPDPGALQRHLQRDQGLCAEPAQSLDAELQGRGVKVQAVLPGVTRPEIWQRSGLDAVAIPAEMVMEVEEMVDAALSGFERDELMTLPSLSDAADCRPWWPRVWPWRPICREAVPPRATSKAT